MRPFCLVTACLLAFSLQSQTGPEFKETGNLVTMNVPEMAPAFVERYDQYHNVRGCMLSDWDSDGQGIYISTRFADVAQIHHVAGASQYRRQMTFFKEPVNGAQSCPDPKRGGFLYSRDQGGNEVAQYYWYDPATGRSQLLTDGKSRHGGAIWNKSGTKVAYANYRRNGRDIDFFMKDLANPQTEIPLRENEGGSWSMSDWTADDRQMIISKYISVNQSELYLFDLNTKQTTPINPLSTPVSYSGALFSKNEQGIYLTCDMNGEFRNLYYYDIAGKKMKNLTEKIPWDIDAFELSEDGSKLVFSANEDGYNKLYLLDTKSNTWKVLNGVPKGLVPNFKFHPDGRRLAMSVNSANSSSDVYVLDVQSAEATRWTFGEIGGLNPALLVIPQLIRFPSFDGRSIPAFLYTPKNATGKTPVVISIHGGPEGQSFPGFNSYIQFLVNEMGFAVAVPNVRGSTGYGKTFVALDNGFKREDSVKDIGALLDWIGQQPGLDANRVAVMGGSYGGYMSLACMTHYNDRLRCGIDLFGISNFVTFLKNTGAFRQDMRRAEYGDERDPDMAAFQQRISPLTNIGNITKPMFIFQGKNDPRVPLSESEQMRDALLAKGNEVWYVMAKDEGHGLAKKNNRDYTQMAMALFLEKYMK